LFGVFVMVERRVPGPLVDLKATARKPIVLTNLASMLFGFALFASLIGTASYVQAPAASGYGFGSSIVVAGLCLLPSGLLMLLLAPVAARLIGAIGANRTLSLGAVIVAAGWLERIFATGSLWEVVVGSTIIGAGTGIGYASMPALINANTPPAELAAANGLNSLARSLGSSLASAIGGSLLTVSTIMLAGAVLPSLTAYRALFAACAGVAVLAAVAALFVPHDPVRAD
jgi:MFS family permease